MVKLRDRDTFCSFFFFNSVDPHMKRNHWLNFTGGVLIRCCLAKEVGKASLACSSPRPNVYVGAGTEATGMRNCLLLQQKRIKEGWVFSTLRTGGGF